MTQEFVLDGETTLKPDYSLTLTEVFVDATSTVLHRRNDLACLILVCDSSLKVIEDLPPWCLDYSTIEPSLREFPQSTRSWQLGVSWTHAKDPNVIGTSILGVDGFRYDGVVETADMQKHTRFSENPRGGRRIEETESQNSPTRYASM
jgi:hypothetical protein